MRLTQAMLLLGLIGASSAADACYCWAARQCLCQESGGCAAAPSVCGQPCRTVMRTCQETVYEEVPQTAYKTVYEEVVEKVSFPAVKYVEETAYHCVPTTVMQPRTPQTCEPVGSCAPAACGPSESRCDMVPVQVLRKVPYMVTRAVPYQKTEERRRVVEKQVPYTIIVCVPKVVYKQVPVTVPCPIPPCCDQPRSNDNR